MQRPALPTGLAEVNKTTERMRDMKRALILSQMICDERLPRNAVGYVLDLQESLSPWPDATPEIIEDRLNMLNRYVPDLVREYREVM